jgi:cytochrome c-type biogenesis protein CcmF
MFFIALATTWPLISETVFDQKATMAPPFYNMFIPPLALVLIFLMGCAPLLGWRKTSKELFYKSFRFPVATALTVGAAHLLLGGRLGFPAFVEADPIFGDIALGALHIPAGDALAWLKGKLPLVTTTLVAFNIAVVIQEFQRGIAARRRKKEEGFGTALFTLISKSRRRYGGYVVHVGIAVMFLGFAGKNWESQLETSLLPGESVSLEEYTITYTGPAMSEDHEKRIVLANVDVQRHGKFVATIKPAQYIYKASPGQPSTEIARYGTLRNDLYVSPGIINATTKQASFRVYVNPLIAFVWLGVGILLLGALISIWPEASPVELGVFGYVRALGSVATMVMLSTLLALAPSTAFGQQHEMRRQGVVEQTPEERALFKQLLCDCGSCPHEPLETCTCGWAHAAREEARAELASGKSASLIVEEYAAKHGSDAVIMQATKGKNVFVWLIPGAAAIGGIVLVVWLSRRWRGSPVAAKEALASGPRDEYDERLDAELKDLE